MLNRNHPWFLLARPNGLSGTVDSLQALQIRDLASSARDPDINSWLVWIETVLPHLLRWDSGRNSTEIEFSAIRA